MQITVSNVILILKPSENAKKPRFTWTVSKPTFKALKKKFFTGPFGKGMDNKYESAEPMIPPMITPMIMFPIFLRAI